MNLAGTIHFEGKIVDQVFRDKEGRVNVVFYNKDDCREFVLSFGAKSFEDLAKKLEEFKKKGGTDRDYDSNNGTFMADVYLAMQDQVVIGSNLPDCLDDLPSILIKSDNDRIELFPKLDQMKALGERIDKIMAIYRSMEELKSETDVNSVPA